MKHQQVSVDYWAMGKAMATYGVLTVMVWLMLKLFNMVFTLPGRLRAQQHSLQNTLQELQRRYPDLNITEDDLKNAEKDLEELIKEDDEKDAGQEKQSITENESEDAASDKPEDKKTI